MENQEVTISIGDTAKELGVSVKTVRRWADAGKLRFERSPFGHIARVSEALTLQSIIFILTDY
ncbi:MAG: hypothetical protein AN485_06770 [Anabaena sp. MDT14b]|jgi:excisionase family DNA binding protein|nr:MAG: hypothetical protein AN485_06770 [Anabaena sp. MDT14b]